MWNIVGPSIWYVFWCPESMLEFLVSILALLLILVFQRIQTRRDSDSRWSTWVFSCLRRDRIVSRVLPSARPSPVYCENLGSESVYILSASLLFKWKTVGHLHWCYAGLKLICFNPQKTSPIQVDITKRTFEWWGQEKIHSAIRHYRKYQGEGMPTISEDIDLWV